MILIHICVFFLSLICYFFFSDILPLEVSYVIIIPYLYKIIKDTKNIKWGFILPPFISTLSMTIFIWISALVVKYNFLDHVFFVNGQFSDLILNKCVYIGLIAISINWLAFNLFFNQFKYRDRLQKYTLHDLKKLKIYSPYLFVLLVLIIYYFITIGSFGYYADPGNRNLTNFTDKFFTLALIIPIYYFLSSKEIHLFNKKGIFYFIALLILSVFGAISGSKSLMVLPFFLLIFVEYLKTNKFFNKRIIYFLAILILAFIVIIPIRYVLKTDTKASRLNQYEVLEMMRSGNKGVIASSIVNLIARINYIPVLADAIMYEGSLPTSVTNLWEYTLMSPLYAIFPRFLFPDKPQKSFANWYAYIVRHSTEANNISATYQGILYMNGGILSIIAGFILVGLFQFLFVNIFFNPKYVYIYLVLLIKVAILPAEPWAFFTSMIQNIIIFLIFHKIIIG